MNLNNEVFIQNNQLKKLFEWTNAMGTILLRILNLLATEGQNLHVYMPTNVSKLNVFTAKFNWSYLHTEWCRSGWSYNYIPLAYYRSYNDTFFSRLYKKYRYMIDSTPKEYNCVINQIYTIQYEDSFNWT